MASNNVCVNILWYSLSYMFIKPGQNITSTSIKRIVWESLYNLSTIFIFKSPRDNIQLKNSIWDEW